MLCHSGVAKVRGIPEFRQCYLEPLVDFPGGRPEGCRLAQPAHHRRDEESAGCGDVIQVPEYKNRGGFDAQLFLRLAQGCGPRVSFTLFRVTAGERDLPGMQRQVVRPYGEQKRHVLAALDQRHQNGGMSESINVQSLRGSLHQELAEALRKVHDRRVPLPIHDLTCSVHSRLPETVAPRSIPPILEPRWFILAAREAYMIYKPAEDSFRKGVQAMKSQLRRKEAMALFEASLLLDSRAQKTSGQPRYRSYYGLCLSSTKGKMKEALKLCRRACEDEFYNYEVWFNLGKVEREAGNQHKAQRALVRALHLSPRKGEIREELKSLGLRRSPLFSFLGRDHALNRFMGRLTYRKPSQASL